MRLLLITLAPALLCLSGCTSGRAHADTTSRTTAQAITEIQATGPKAEAHTVAIAALAGAGGGADLKALYKDFSTTGSTLQRQFAAIATDASTVQGKGEAYAGDWEKRISTVQDPTISEPSKQRLDQLKAGLERLNLSRTDYEQALVGFTNRFKDLTTALDLDLSPGGVAALRGSLNTLKTSIPAVQKQANVIADRLKSIEEFLAGPAPVEATPAAP